MYDSANTSSVSSYEALHTPGVASRHACSASHCPPPSQYATRSSTSQEPSYVPTSVAEQSPVSPPGSDQALPTQRCRRRKFGRPKMHDSQKSKLVYSRLKRALRFFETLHVSFSDVVQAWLMDVNGQARQRRVRKIQEVLDLPRTVEDMEDTVFNALYRELDQLANQDYFKKFEPDENLEEAKFGDAVGTVKQKAPMWYKFTDHLLRNARASGAAYKNQLKAKAFYGRVFFLTSYVVHARQKITASYFMRHLSVYLLNSGTKRRVIDVFNNLGVCGSYTVAVDDLKLIAEEAKASNIPCFCVHHYVANNMQQKLKDVVAETRQLTIAYDNINFKDSVRDQALGSKGTQRNLTTALLIECPELPVGGLKQGMHNPAVELDADAIIENVGQSRDEFYADMARYFIVEALGKMHGDSVSHVWMQENAKPAGERFSRPAFPRIDQLSHTIPTKFYQLGAIYEDEGTINGTYGVQDRIFDYLGCNTAEKKTKFRDRIWLAYGDQKTAHHIRVVKREQQASGCPYERRRWLLGPIGWFHVRQNFLTLILRVYWDDMATGRHPAGTLKDDYLIWQRAGINRDNAPFYLLEPLVMQSWTARIVSLWYRFLEDEDELLMPPEPSNRERDINDASWKENREAWDAAIKRMTASQMLSVAQKIQSAVFTYSAWNDDTNGIEWRSWCRFLQAGFVYYQLKYAVKFGDIGILRRLLPELAVWFFGADMFNYGYEMLHMEWLLSKDVSTPELQRSILAGSVVNLSGTEGGFKATDLCVEHVNCNSKIDMKMHKNSTHDVDITFGRRALVSRYAAQQRRLIERTYRRLEDQQHKFKSVQLDLFNLARRRAKDGPRPGAVVSGAFSSSDILRLGLKVLDEKVRKFNEDHVEGRGRIMPPYSEASDNGVPLHRRDYVEATDISLDDDLDPAVCFEADVPAYTFEVAQMKDGAVPEPI